ncbi:MAG: hypothetical protein M0Q42_05375 [Xanthomonadales bacterium]|nr:hypothetical protein [Xanthomonadales bacterium]
MTARLALLLTVALLAACGGVGTEKNRMEETLYHYAGAVRWGDVEQLLAFQDPEVLSEAPPERLTLERWRQWQVTGYRARGREPQPDGSIVQYAEIDLVNRHTQQGSVLLDRERWRYDEDARRWWLMSGLPDLDARSDP